jgi:hypothetical protein
MVRRTFSRTRPSPSRAWCTRASATACTGSSRHERGRDGLQRCAWKTCAPALAQRRRQHARTAGLAPTPAPGSGASAWRRSTRDGPFSAFPASSAGLSCCPARAWRLHAGPRLVHMTRASPPLQFDGAGAPGCLLLDGPTLDLNLMVRHDAGTGGLHAHRASGHCSGAAGLLLHHLRAPAGGDQARFATPAPAAQRTAAGQTWRWFADDVPRLPPGGCTFSPTPPPHPTAPCSHDHHPLAPRPRRHL